MTISPTPPNGFLSYLDADPDRAAAQYFRLRRRLLAFFSKRRCWCYDDLADETVARVIQKIAEGQPIEHFTAYVLGVARNVYFEWLKHAARIEPLPEIVAGPPTPRDACLRKCLGELPADRRELVEAYFLDHHTSTELAGRLQLTLNALRIRVFRAKAHIADCMRDCLEASARR